RSFSTIRPGGHVAPSPHHHTAQSRPGQSKSSIVHERVLLAGVDLLGKIERCHRTRYSPRLILSVAISILSVAISKGYGSYCAMLVRNHTLAVSIKGAVRSLEVLCNARTRRRNCPLGTAI